MTPDSDHPDLQSLFRYWEGGPAERQQNDIEAHVHACAHCQGILRALASAASLPADFPTPPISELMTRLAKLQRDLSQEGSSGSALKRRVESELIPYLGARAAHRILEQVAPGGENLLSTIESVVRPFLGESAAGRLVSGIVDRAIMRT